MGGGGTETSSQTTGATDAMGDPTVTKLLSNLNTQVDKGTAVYPLSSYPGMSGQTTGAIGALSNAAVNGAGGLNNAYGWAQGQVADGGLTGGQRASIGTTGAVGNQFGSMAASAQRAA